MCRCLSRRTIIISSLVSFVLLVVTWRMAPSSIRNPLNLTKSVPLLKESLTRDKTYTITKNATLPTDKTYTITKNATLPTEITILPTQVDVEHDKYQQRLNIPEYDTIPYSQYLKKREKLLKSEWISALYTFLQTLHKSVSPHVNLVFRDDNHRNLVMNWITSALMILEPPLRSVMVLSLHHSLCDYLKAKTLPLTCITVTPDSLFILNHPSESGDWLVGVMVRLTVLRFINYWGYDFAAYDSDAVLLHNPQVLYSERQQVDVFTSSGTFPFDVSRKWGVALCIGTVMFRATPAVEALWRHISAVKTTRDDQEVLNWGLQHMDVKWKETTKSNEICSLRNGWESEGAIKVFVFPQDQFCRSCCKPNMSQRSQTTLYLVHPLSDKKNLETKEKALKKLQAWFLNDKSVDILHVEAH